jgi:peptide/nickel transport system substrate-binding protein
VARGVALAAAVAVALLAVSGAGGAATQQTPKRGGTVVIATLTSAEPPCLNAFVQACGLPGPLDRGLHEVLAGAFEAKPDGTFRPDLISRAEVVSRRPVTLVYHIRPEARWSDGVPVTASDFVFTYRAILEYRPEWFEFEALDKVRSVRALDAKTFKAVLRAPFPDWQRFFAAVLPRHALAGKDLENVWKDRIDNPKTREPIGSGPFLVGRWERGKQLTFVRNPRYWGAHAAYLDRIVFRFLPPEGTEGAAEALRRGEVDMIVPFSRILQAEALELLRQPAPGVRVLRVVSASSEHFDIRIGPGGHPALKSRLVRQALAYGIDRVAIAREIGKLSLGSEAALEPLDSVVFLANSPYYRPNWKRYRHRPDRARQLLEQAGCRRGADGIYSCAGDRLSLRFATIAGIESRARTLELAQAQLRRVGVEVRPVYAVFDTFFVKIVLSGDFDVALFSHIVGAGTVGPGEIFQCQRPENTTGYCDRLVSRDVDQATRILDDSRRVGLLNRVDARLARAAPYIPLYQNKGLFALGARVRGVVPNGVGRFTWNAENWWLAQPR